MNIYIFDIEVFSDDWIIVFRKPDKKNHIVIHNDNFRLREFLSQDDIVIGGFNNKHYDDYILKTILKGGSNIEVKRCNDFIIGGGVPWEFTFIQYTKKTFKSFDLRDDIADDSISLKAIEGNLHRTILESNVSFNINRPLTDAELKEVIHYCKMDVDATVDLYFSRKEDYIDAKLLVAEMYGVPKDEAIGLTNAKLSARVLNATYKERSDERDYKIPKQIDLKKIPKIVLDFFMQIRDKSIPDAKLFGSGKGQKGLTLELWIKTKCGKCPVTYAWGGVHGAKPCVIVEETKDRIIINYDVLSLYPNSMINFGYCSRNMADPKAYEKLVEKRLGYKKAGDDTKAKALKLVVNTVYGAMLSQGNPLNDRLNGRSVCITNQLSMTMLIYDLGTQCETIDFININTDGVMFSLNKTEVTKAESIVSEWCKTTGFEMERDDFKKVIQKDVNNYIGIKGDGHFKTKGGFVSLYNGGNFKTNSMPIIDISIVEYLVNGVKPEKTINDCKDILQFQKIVKTGNKYDGCYHYINNERYNVQKVNRIYAVNNKQYGQIYKGKWVTEKRRKNKDTGKMEVTKIEPVWQETVVADCPEHCCIDNENTLTIDKLDLSYYIDIAYKRIDRYLNIDKTVARRLNKIESEVILMATSKTTKNVYQRLLDARQMFLASDIKKKGVNAYAEFDYFRLEEIIPIKQKIFEEVGLLDVICFGQDTAYLTLYNVDDPTQVIEFKSQLAPDESLIKNPIQKVGAIQTYVRRYLYMLALDIVESDTVDAISSKPEKAKSKPKTPKTTEERKEIAKELTDESGSATDTQIKSIKKGLSKLRESDKEDFESYIKDCVTKIKSGINKEDADDMLKDIGEKLNN